MILSMSSQAWLFLYTVAVGMGIGLFYDVFRVIRKTTPHASLTVQLEDMFFWVIVTGCMFYFMLNQNYGEIRLFTMVGAGCGIALYFATISRVVLKVAVITVNYLKRVFSAAFKIILLPINFIWSLISPFTKKFAKNRRKDLHGMVRYGKIRIRKTTRNWFILRKKV